MSTAMYSTKPFLFQLPFVLQFVAELETATVYQSSKLTLTAASLGRRSLIHSQDFVVYRENLRGQQATTHKGVQ
jgi:hypothetical protein